HLAATSMPSGESQGVRGADRGHSLPSWQGRECTGDCADILLPLLSLRDRLSHNEKQQFLPPQRWAGGDLTELGEARRCGSRRTLAYALHTPGQDNTAQQGLAPQT